MGNDVVIARAIDVFGDPGKASLWLNRPNRALSGSTPRSLLSTKSGSRRVLILLGRIERSVYS